MVVNCSKCQKTFSNNSNLKRHLKGKHSEYEKKENKCNVFRVIEHLKENTILTVIWTLCISQVNPNSALFVATKAWTNLR